MINIIEKLILPTITDYEKVVAALSQAELAAKLTADLTLPVIEGVVWTLKEEYANAVNFYNEAIQLEQVDSLKYTYAIEKGNALYKNKRYAEAKSAALQAISFDSKQGEPYMLLATIYATVDPYPEDPILNKTKFWAAVDKLQTAKSLEPELAEKANTLINSYRKFYPTKEEVFFKPELSPGSSFTVGGIINQSVRCRD
jgi:tetratricopeptide (TPR) repeat protein